MRPIRQGRVLPVVDLDSILLGSMPLGHSPRQMSELDQRLLRREAANSIYR